jgi:CheY-like chemotaxis protein
VSELREQDDRVAATGRIVWLIDDDADCLEIGRRALESGGYQVVCFGSPREALACKGERPVAIVTDLMMDAVDEGLSFARQARQDPLLAKVPIIVTTAIEQRLGLNLCPRTDADLAAMQVDAFVPKPATGARLKGIIEGLLARGT